MDDEFSDYSSSSDGDSVSVSSKGSIKEAREDIKLMNVVRAIVILTLLTAAFITAETVFVITVVSEEGDFRDAYNEAAGQLIQGFYDNLDHTLWVARTLSKDIANDAEDDSWPFVTISNFDDRCEGPLHMSGATIVSLDPLVSEQELSSFEVYAIATHSIPSTPSGAPSDSETVYRFPTERTVKQGVYGFKNGTASRIQDDPTSYGYFPMWQVSPSLGNATTGLIGTLFEESSNPVRAKALKDVMERSGSIMSNFLFQDTDAADFSLYESPRSSLYYPVFQTVKKNLVATINMELETQKLFEKAVEDEFTEPLLVVVENSCGGQFTFNVTGSQAVYGGVGDLHAGREGLSYDVQNITKEEFADIFDDHGAVAIDLESGCNYVINVHPSADFEKSYSTARPDIFRAVVLGAFLFIIVVFLVYDQMVEKRQKKVVDAAVRSDTIVRSLFPSNVRDRLYENAKKKEQLKEAGKNQGVVIETQRNRLKQFVNHGSVDENAFESAPIADLYPKTTGMSGCLYVCVCLCRG